jgi:hypothetical protein
LASSLNLIAEFFTLDLSFEAYPTAESLTVDKMSTTSEGGFTISSVFLFSVQNL